MKLNKIVVDYYDGAAVLCPVYDAYVSLEHCQACKHFQGIESPESLPSSGSLKVLCDFEKGRRRMEIEEILIEAIEAGLAYLPDSPYYTYCWDECTDDEQEQAKKTRKKMQGVLRMYRASKEASEFNRKKKRDE